MSVDRFLRQILFGAHHRFYALMAAVIAVVPILIYGIGIMSGQRFTAAMSVYLMSFFGATVSLAAHGGKPIAGSHFLQDHYWKIGKFFYLAATFAGILHIILFNQKSATLLQVAGALASAWLIPSLILWLRSLPSRS